MPTARPRVLHERRRPAADPARRDGLRDHRAPGHRADLARRVGLLVPDPAGLHRTDPAAYVPGDPLYRGLAVNQRNPYIPTPEDFAAWLHETVASPPCCWMTTRVEVRIRCWSRSGSSRCIRATGSACGGPVPTGLRPVDEAAVVSTATRTTSAACSDASRSRRSAAGRGSKARTAGRRCSRLSVRTAETCAAHLHAPWTSSLAPPRRPGDRGVVLGPRRRQHRCDRGARSQLRGRGRPAGRLATASFAQPMPFMDQPTPFSILVQGEGRSPGRSTASGTPTRPPRSASRAPPTPSASRRPAAGCPGAGTAAPCRTGSPVEAAGSACACPAAREKSNAPVSGSACASRAVIGSIAEELLDERQHRGELVGVVIHRAAQPVVRRGPCRAT